MTQNKNCQSTSTSTQNHGKRYPAVNPQLRGGKRKPVTYSPELLKALKGGRK